MSDIAVNELSGHYIGTTVFFLLMLESAKLINCEVIWLWCPSASRKLTPGLQMLLLYIKGECPAVVDVYHLQTHCQMAGSTINRYPKWEIDALIGPEDFVNWTEQTEQRHLTPVPRTEQNELSKLVPKELNWCQASLNFEQKVLDSFQVHELFRPCTQSIGFDETLSSE